MSNKINYRHLSAEFLIVFVGVAVALAADSWREDLQERGLENAYLSRIENDLEIGLGIIERLISQFGTAFESTDILIERLEENSISGNESLLVEHFTKATRTGRPGRGLGHGAVYSELLSTGRLVVIANPTLRVALSDYYRSLDQLASELDTLPATPWERYRELTGNEAGHYMQLGQFPEGNAAERLVSELSSGDLSVRQFRLLRTRLDLIIGRAERQLSDNLSLLDSVRSEID
ncbi:MAG: hypothetical protein RLP02_16095 [Coleofasciculus sp. C2-GNP5-27]